MIRRLQVRNFRNIQYADLQLHPSFNIIIGKNGSGKSSILEAIYAVTYGKSYRTNRAKNIIQLGQQSYTLYGEHTDQTEQGHTQTVGLNRFTDSFELQINRRKSSSLVHFSKDFPVQIIEPFSYSLLNDGPDNRRKFIDWGMFHVEHSFYELWNQLKTSLKQRNALLKSGKINDPQMNYWTEKFCRSSEQLTELRKDYIFRLNHHVSSILRQYANFDSGEIEIDLFQGWDRKLDLATSLKRNEIRDQKQKYTSAGPHRADLRITTQRNDVADILSRGQQKLLITSLKLAQLRIFDELGITNTVLLVDDIDSELDEEHINLVINILNEFGSQVILTSTNNTVTKNLPATCEGKMFHVEHGSITRSEHLEKNK